MVFPVPTTTSASTAMYPTVFTAPGHARSRSIDLASQVDPSTHDRRVVEMVNTPMSYGVYDYLLDTIVFTVASAMIGPPAKVALGLKNTRLTQVVKSFIEYGGITMPAVLATLVYLNRVRPHLEIDSEDWVCERLALGALITAQKYIIDYHVGTTRWAAASGLFTKADINRMEREFLSLLNFEMRITEADLLEHHDGLRRATRKCMDVRPRNNTVFSRRERAEYRYPMHSHVHTPVAETPSGPATAALHLPDLMYPFDSPGSNDSPPVITPPDAHPLRGAKRAAHTTNPYLARAYQPYPAARGQLEGDREMEARVRWYMADPNPHPRPSPYGPPADSPRFEPFSPPTTRYERPQQSASRESTSPWRRNRLADHDPLGFFKQR